MPKDLWYFPGGFGTLDELFEALTLIQTYKIDQFPVVLVGKHFWEGLLTWIREVLLEREHNISQGDIDLFTVVDTADEVVEHITEFYRNKPLIPNF